MLDTILGSVTQNGMTFPMVLLCTVVSLVLGVGIALGYRLRSTCSKSFLVTLALLPAVVEIVIMLVNGNLGVGVAVMGAFSLVRFRSVPGSAKEIGAIFLAMAIGLATGMGYLAYAAVFLVVIGAAALAMSLSKFGEPKQVERELRITIPENLDYEGLFDDLFTEYTMRTELVRVKTTNMGSLYELSYHVLFRTPAVDKRFLDALRCRNGNLTIVCGRLSAVHDEL